jgi:hypothetical protein
MTVFWALVIVAWAGSGDAISADLHFTTQEACQQAAKQFEGRPFAYSVTCVEVK